MVGEVAAEVGAGGLGAAAAAEEGDAEARAGRRELRRGDDRERGGAVGGNNTLSSCGRYTATDVSGLFAAVVLAGGSVTESCGATAAFGSGGTVNSSLRAGIGGGGAYFGGDQTTTVGGPSAVVLYFTA